MEKQRFRVEVRYMCGDCKENNLEEFEEPNLKGFCVFCVDEWRNEQNE